MMGLSAKDQYIKLYVARAEGKSARCGTVTCARRPRNRRVSAMRWHARSEAEDPRTRPLRPPRLRRPRPPRSRRPHPPGSKRHRPPGTRRLRPRASARRHSLRKPKGDVSRETKPNIVCRNALLF